MAELHETEIVRLLHREAELIDRRQWDEWLELMTPDIEYWVPAWNYEMEYTSDPDAQLSLIYYDSRIGLEDRVFRLKSQKSAASVPIPRTCHMVTNIRPRLQSDGSCAVDANWQVLAHRNEETSTFFGFYAYLLVRDERGWKIRKKKIIVLNDLIPTVLDIYLI